MSFQFSSLTPSCYLPIAFDRSNENMERDWNQANSKLILLDGSLWRVLGFQLCYQSVHFTERCFSTSSCWIQCCNLAFCARFQHLLDWKIQGSFYARSPQIVWCLLHSVIAYAALAIVYRLAICNQIKASCDNHIHGLEVFMKN